MLYICFLVLFFFLSLLAFYSEIPYQKYFLLASLARTQIKNLLFSFINGDRLLNLIEDSNNNQTLRSHEVELHVYIFFIEIACFDFNDFHIRM